MSERETCPTCLRPAANDEDWDTIPEGEGQDLCWEEMGYMCELDAERLRTYDPRTHRAISVEALRQLAFAGSDRLAEIERVVDVAKGEAWLKIKRDETRDALAEARELLKGDDDAE